MSTMAGAIRIFVRPHMQAPVRLCLSIRFADGGVQSRRPRERRSSCSAVIRGEPMVRVHKSVTIKRPPGTVYEFWRQLENLPRFMYHLQEVRATSEGRSHWVAKAPAGQQVEWDAEIVEDRPNEALAWRTLPGSDVQHEGSVRFKPAPADRGTEVEVQLQYDAPGGSAGAFIAGLFGEEPTQQIRD